MRSVLADFCGTEPTAGGARPRQLHDSWCLGKMQEGSTKSLGAGASALTGGALYMAPGDLKTH